MSEIKSIDTKFKGYQFRSRLEAHWAVFFEKLGLLWRYESEGFELLNGEWYLPDFHLVNEDIWLEIKPIKESVETWPEHPAFKCFSEDSPMDNFYLLKGRPYLKGYSYDDGEQTFIHSFEDQHYMAWPGYDMGYYFCECPDCGKIGIEFEGRANRLDCDCRENEFHNPASERLLKAYKVASEYRFEYKDG